MRPSRSQPTRSDSIQRRIASARSVAMACAVPDCDQTVTTSDGTGLNRHYCRRHVEHFRRHGSYSKKSYTAAELNGYRSGALRWLQEHVDRPEVQAAVESVLTLYRRGGRPEEAFRLAGRSPEERAKLIWARLRVRKVDPLVPIAAWLAIALRHEEDLQPERRVEFRWVQVAKILHRIAGGSHKRWQRSGHIPAIELHKYPASRGRVLRHIGEALANAVKPMMGCVDEIRTSCQNIHTAPSRLPRVRRRSS